jgi:hypothetical protein
MNMVLVVSLLMTSMLACNVGAQNVPREPKPWRLADVLPDTKEQKALRKRHLGPISFVRHLIPHLPVVWMDTNEVPDEVAAQLSKLVGPRKLIRMHAGMLLDGRQVYTGVSDQDPDSMRCQRGLLVLNVESGEIAACTLPRVTLQDDWRTVPPLQQVDTDQDGEMEVMLKVHHHNGTVEDFDAQHYLRVVGKRLVADIVIREAAWLIEPPNEGGYVRQALLFDGPLAVRVVTWFEYADEANSLVPLGECHLRRPGMRLPFEQLGVTAWVAGTDRWLLPSSSDFDEAK